MRILVIGVLLALPFISQAQKEDENRYPIGCLDTGYYYKMKTITLMPHEKGTNDQGMYFFHNISNQPVDMYQMRGEESDRSLYLNHTIKPNQWAVLATSENTVRFICARPVAKKSYGQVVDCTDHVKICQFTNVRFGLNNKGNYWIVDNTDRNSAVRGVVYYGIIP